MGCCEDVGMSRKRWQGRPKAAALSRRAGPAASSLLHHPRVWWRQRRSPDAIVTSALAAAGSCNGPTSSGRNRPAQGRAGRDLCGYGQKRTFCCASERARGRQGADH